MADPTAPEQSAPSAALHLFRSFGQPDVAPVLPPPPPISEKRNRLFRLWDLGFVAAGATVNFDAGEEPERWELDVATVRGLYAIAYVGGAPVASNQVVLGSGGRATLPGIGQFLSVNNPSLAALQGTLVAVSGLPFAVNHGAIESSNPSIANPVSLAQLSAARLAADGLALPSTADVLALNMARNQAGSEDIWRNNLDGTAIPTANYTSVQASADFTNYNWRNMIVGVKINAAGTGNLNLKIDWKDPVNGYMNVITGVNIVGTGLFVYGAGPGQSGGGQTTLPFGRIFRIQVTHSDGSLWNYGVGYSLFV